MLNPTRRAGRMDILHLEGGIMKMAKTSKTISYAESIRRLKDAWDNEPVTFIGGISLNYNVCYND